MSQTIDAHLSANVVAIDNNGNASTLSKLTSVTGVTNQITVTTGDGSASIGLASDVVLDSVEADTVEADSVEATAIVASHSMVIPSYASNAIPEDLPANSLYFVRSGS